ncbi:chorismate mutase [Synechococcus sp. Cruz-9H2]|uniref:chorismate mutase n=1 Tax=unclassified Synechococcus TaxID=2626047 RepID=UPI0020CBF264|nr:MULTISPECIES: chorismate mutase [unclassified Synechococcus]MCP9818733.1 chorismate mutase [Synechococcus sp. Cruz-9H2]MCP9842963.1 chorismate mutase [Synechococcus sp. Edmonson 11F2]MCP9855988.1 chorismate mutase [Synechococcus sp. Cruz-9C9]MCP9862125.1 chorismate mutase [Synechococcus sp. Cruz-7E5]MCP9869396.1 chorismate mutase [Synechococcus sp. Cruz-7B9]
MSEARELRALRGATTATSNTTAAIDEAVSELLASLIDGNGLSGAWVLSVTFSVTADLDAGFPAAIARRQPGWDGVALLDCQQMAVAGDLPRCIRLLAHAWMEPGRQPLHPYLREAARLRPDRSGHN